MGKESKSHGLTDASPVRTPSNSPVGNKKKPAFDVKAMEKKWLDFWEKKKVYRFGGKSGKKIYSIDTPPPTVSGTMHIGHAYSYSQQDFIARYKRMKGFEVFYPFGTDDNGLPTERLIEKIKGVKSKSMSREEFIKLCLKTLGEIRPGFVQGWKDLGMSCDFGICYSTIDDNSRKLSQRSFINLYRKGEVYKADFPTIFCPECQTPVAQAELEDKTQKSKFSTIKFEVEGQEIRIATTRPELIGACVAIFVNPKDKRFNRLIGKKAKTPLYGQEVEIFGDESADMKKGTGALMVCSYGDKYDVDAIKRLKLKPKVIFNSDGTLNDSRYKGLKIKEARKRVLEDLDKKGAVVEQKEIEHVVNVHDKCGAEIEFLPVEQWFVKILHKKGELINQGKKIKWKPSFMFKRYENWIKGLEWDWSISRERHFGVPIPVWYCEKCGSVVLASEKELPVDPLVVKKKCEKCGCSALGESKVLDTWMTSSLTPEIASSLVGNKIKLPYSLRPQAHDIIRTWAFYTIVKALFQENKIPWEEIGISGFVKLEGRKMSKSKGNVISPRKIMEEYGADALRYTAASQRFGEDTDFRENDIAVGKKFVTKILNASNFVFLNLKEWDGKKPMKLVETDRLFLSLLEKLLSQTEKDFDEHNYSKVKMAIDSFFWKTFADNYLEMVKKRVYNGTEAERASAFYALCNGLWVLLRLFAPFTPFVCEEIYQNHFAKRERKKSVHLCEWPSKVGVKQLRHDEKTWEKLVEVIGKVRQKKSEMKKPMNAEIILTLSPTEMKELEEVLGDLCGVTCAREIKQGAFGVSIF